MYTKKGCESNSEILNSIQNTFFPIWQTIHYMGRSKLRIGKRLQYLHEDICRWLQFYNVVLNFQNRFRPDRIDINDVRITYGLIGQANTGYKLLPFILAK